jgi:hypothetical protein
MSQDPLHTTKALFLALGLTIGLLRVAPANAQTVLLDHDPAIVDSRFGYALAIDSAGHTAIVGSAQASIDVNLRDNTGAAYVFERVGAAWQRTQRLISADVDATDGFGSAVSLSADGHVALIGALMDENGGLASGAAYIFERADSGLVQRHRLESRDPALWPPAAKNSTPGPFT